jgi:broad specificity phosphatase PhoE
MRRLLTWLGVAAGALIVVRRRFRRRKVEAVAVDHAEELKRKLAETRADEPQAAPPAPEPEAEPAKPSLEERRRAVHDRARQAIDEMLGGEDLPGEESE